jgi:hypothetical protein
MRAYRQYRRAQRLCRRAQRLCRIEPRSSASAAMAHRRPKATHTICNVLTDAVFHAPMFALNAFASRNACEPKHTRSTPTKSARMC